MRILILGGDSRVAQRLLLNIDAEVYRTTRREVVDEDQIFCDLDKKIEFLGSYDVVVVCACDFKRGRSDQEQAKCWKTNVDGIKSALSSLFTDHVIFLSSYLADTGTAYGNQKKEIESWIKQYFDSSVLRIGRIESESDYEEVVDSIIECIEERKIGKVKVLCE